VTPADIPAAAQLLFRRLVQTLARVRWVTKWRLVKGSGASPWAELGYILWDPELESFSFEVDNEAELVRALARVLRCPSDELAGYAAELKGDPELHERLRRRVRLRPWLKRRLPAGRRLAWYLVARQLKPALIVEAGIFDGLGSLVLLRALARNAEQDAPGELLSVDVDPYSGELVAPRLRGRWTRVIGSTREVLEPALAGRRVSMFLQDTPHTEENQQFEFGVVLRHADETLALFDESGGWAPTLPRLCQQVGADYYHLPLRPRHFYRIHGVALAIVAGERAAAWSSSTA
jgi:hypothetical protein